MSLNDILGSAMSGLAASQASLRSVSNNIANVGTTGYARERVMLSTAVTAGRVSGVQISEPSRIADQFLESTVYRRAGDAGQAEVTASYLDRLQSLLGAPGVESSLPARLDAINASAITMTGSPSATQAVSAFTADVQDAIFSVQRVDQDVDGLRADVEAEVGYTVEKVNVLLERIFDLNDSISRLDGTGRSSAGAGDQRMSAIEELSGLVKLTVRNQPDGRVTLETPSGAVLLDRHLRQLSYPVTGQGAAQSTYPPIGIRFADAAGGPGAATGESIDSAAIGAKLGGLLDLRDRMLPAFSEKLGTLFSGLAETLNAASNAGTVVPAPARLEGARTALVGGDRLGFTGAATFAVAAADGTLVARTRIDFDALGAGATVDDAVAAINAGLGGAAVASFTGGRLTLQASGAGSGVVVAQDDARPSARAGVGFSHYFGLNDLVTSGGVPRVPSGFTAADAHGFATGQTADIVLRDATGRALTRYTLTGTGGSSFGDLTSELNASPLGSFGSFTLDARGRLRFEADPTVPGATLSIPSDSTDRLGTGRSFSSIVSLTGSSSGLAGAQVRPDIAGDPTRLPLARLNLTATVGQKALGTGDIRGTSAFVDRLAQAVDLGKDGVIAIGRFAGQLIGSAGTQAAAAQAKLTDTTARRDDAINRRDNFSGVNIDEELAQMVVLQNSYSAAARVLTTASQMYDTLIAMVG